MWLFDPNSSVVQDDEGVGKESAEPFGGSIGWGRTGLASAASARLGKYYCCYYYYNNYYYNNNNNNYYYNNDDHNSSNNNYNNNDFYYFY